MFGIRRLIIAGPRDVEDIDLIRRSIKFFGLDAELEVIIDGGCETGIDRTARYHAKVEGIPNETIPADWDRYGKRAGPIRNREMAKQGDALLAIWNGKTKGTADMLKAAAEEGIPAFIWSINHRKVR